MAFTRKSADLTPMVDGVFAIAQLAKEDKAANGEENVVDATIGSLYGEEGQLVALDTVFDHYDAIDHRVKARYASGIIGNPGQANYSTSKAGVIGLTKSTAKELVSRGVRCNAVAPGFIATDMTANLSKNNKLVDMIPMKRMGTADEVADLIFFLASDASSYITGEIIKVDGGVAI